MRRWLAAASRLRRYALLQNWYVQLQHYYQTVNNILLYCNVILYNNKYKITTEGERTSRAYRS
jgi:hypothetical protein